MEDEQEYIKAIFIQNGYKYIDLIGRGSFATVYLCHCLKYNNLFAIKRVQKHKVADQEINSLITLIHPYIVKLYDKFSDENYHYLVLEYCPNGTIKQKNKLDYGRFVFYAKQILEVIDYCHSQQIAHRDIKPDNIFIDQYDHVKLGDFGFADQFNSKKISIEKCGSLLFFAPEMFENNEFDPFKTDIWALGITFFYMATGRYPYPTCTNEVMRLLIPNFSFNFNGLNVDPSIQSLIMKMTSKNVLFRPTAHKILKFPIFAPQVQSKLSRNLLLKKKSDAFYKTKKRSSICLGLASFANGPIKDEDDNPEIEINSCTNPIPEKRMKIQKIHSLRSCDFFLNVAKSHHHFTQYD